MRAVGSHASVADRSTRLRSALIIAAGLFVPALVLACSADLNVSQIDRSVLAIADDAGACWQRICPGVADTSDVIAAIGTLSFVAPDSHRFRDVSWLGLENATSLVWDCTEPKRRWCGEGIFFDGSLQYLWLALDRGIPIRELVALHGAPDHVVHTDDPWTTACQVETIWVDVRIVAVTRALKHCSDLLSQSASVGLSSAFRVASVGLYSGTAFARLLEDRESSLQPWPGISNSALSTIQLIPGSYSMWATMVVAVAFVAIVGIVKPRVNSALIAFPVAGITVLGPTMAFQFSDVCIPSIGAWFMNSLLLGFLYMGIIEGLRRIRSRALSNRT